MELETPEMVPAALSSYPLINEKTGGKNVIFIQTQLYHTLNGKGTKRGQPWRWQNIWVLSRALGILKCWRGTPGFLFNTLGWSTSKNLSSPPSHLWPNDSGFLATAPSLFSLFSCNCAFIPTVPCNLLSQFSSLQNSFTYLSQWTKTVLGTLQIPSQQNTPKPPSTSTNTSYSCSFPLG